MTPAPNRRWLRFSLRTLFVVVTILCAVTAWASWRMTVAARHQALYARLGAQRVTLSQIPENGDVALWAEPYWDDFKAALGYETVYEVWVEFNADTPKRPDLKADLVALQTMFPHAKFWGLFRGCGQLIDIDELE